MQKIPQKILSFDANLRVVDLREMSHDVASEVELLKAKIAELGTVQEDGSVGIKFGELYGEERYLQNLAHSWWTIR